MVKNLSEDLRHILCYPTPNDECFNARVLELNRLNVALIIPYGRIFLKGKIKVLGKGYASIVVKAVDLEDNVVALKIRRVDSRRSSLIHEAENLALANTVNVGPRLLGFTENIIMYEYVNGIKLKEFIESMSENHIVKMISDLFKQCFRLDMIGLDHGELSRPYSHILVRKPYKPYIIDFESSSVLRKPSNLTSIISSLIIREGPLQQKLRVILGVSNKQSLIEALREYKRNISPRTFLKILKLLNLA